MGTTEDSNHVVVPSVLTIMSPITESDQFGFQPHFLGLNLTSLVSLTVFGDIGSLPVTRVGMYILPPHRHRCLLPTGTVVVGPTNLYDDDLRIQL